ncbi:MAG: 5'/3'-nucleotidase SurE [Candidatus Thorarchaeota archaeon]|nr:5'/3'-nucleotidase SurE [Candidatus Thorarchaeota archaeon]
MYRVCLTNDDGPRSDGLLKLAEVLSKDVELFVVVPDGQRSASGKALTLKSPIRITEQHKQNGYTFVSHDGLPADSVILAESFFENIDIFVSGPNTGANLGYQSMLTSGTVGAAFEAAIRGIPAIAVSREASPQEWFDSTGSTRECEIVCRMTKDIVMRVLDKGMPKGIDLLNLNFPCDLSDTSELVVTKPTKIRMHNKVERRVDPNGRPYFWYLGIETDPPEGTDAYEVLVKNNISLSPVIIEFIHERDIETLRKFMAD